MDKGKAYLDLIVYQHCPDFPCTLGEQFEPFGLGSGDAAFTLDGLDNHSARVFIHQRIDTRLIHIIQLANPDAGDERGEGCLVLRIRGHAQRAHRSAVEGIGKAHDPRLVFPSDLFPVLARKFQRALVRFCSRVGKEHLGPTALRLIF